MFQILKLRLLSLSFIKVNQSPFLDQLIPLPHPNLGPPKKACKSHPDWYNTVNDQSREVKQVLERKVLGD